MPCGTKTAGEVKLGWMKINIPGSVEACLFAFPLGTGERPLSKTAPYRYRLQNKSAGLPNMLLHSTRGRFHTTSFTAYTLQLDNIARILANLPIWRVLKYNKLGVGR